MTQDPKTRRIILFLTGLLILFASLVLIRFTGREDSSTSPDGMAYEDRTDVRGGGSFSVKNYASEIIKKSAPAAMQYDSHALDIQRYEKTAVVNSSSSNFETDLRRTRGLVQDFDAVIQYEHSSGLPGRRENWFYIGVDPESFDSFYHAVLRIGVVRATEVTKEDKTREYLQLNARRESLKNALQSLRELKSKGNNISDLIMLNDRILEAENNLQQLGVELGSFEQERELCTVKISLTERKPPHEQSFAQRLWSATVWALPVLFGIVFLLLLLLAIAYLFHVVFDKYKMGDKQK